MPLAKRRGSVSVRSRYSIHRHWRDVCPSRLAPSHASFWTSGTDDLLVTRFCRHSLSDRCPRRQPHRRGRGHAGMGVLSRGIAARSLCHGDIVTNDVSLVIVWVICSDDRGVANLGHHAPHHVVEIVAVKRPAAGIVGVEGDGDAAHRWHQNGISHGTCERGTVYRDNLESVAMKVHRMRHHRMVHQLDRHALTVGDHQWGYVGPVFAIQRPSIWRHGAGHDPAVHYVARPRPSRPYPSKAPVKPAI